MKFDPSRLARLNDPARTRSLDIEALWQGFGVVSPRQVVDLGAGTGFFAARFAGRLAPGGTIHACDSSQPMVDWMKENLGADPRARIEALLVTESSIDLPDSSIDLLYMINVFHELADPVKTLSEARRIVRPAAPVAIVDWKRGDSIFEGERQGPLNERRVEASAARAALEGAGFTDIRQLDTLPLHFFLVGRAA